MPNKCSCSSGKEGLSSHWTTASGCLLIQVLFTLELSGSLFRRRLHVNRAYGSIFSTQPIVASMPKTKMLSLRYKHDPSTPKKPLSPYLNVLKLQDILSFQGTEKYLDSIVYLKEGRRYLLKQGTNICVPVLGDCYPLILRPNAIPVVN